MGEKKQAAMLSFLHIRRVWSLGIGSLVGNETLGQGVELVLVLIEATELEIEHGATEEGERGHESIEPHQQGVLGQTDESLADGSGEGCHEKGDSLDHGAHVLGGLREGVFQRGDGSKNFGESDEDVRTRLGPDVDGSRLTATHLTERLIKDLTGSVPATLGAGINVVLDDRGPNHGSATGHEATGNLLDGRKANAHLTQGGIDEEIVKGNEDEESEGVQVAEDIVRNAMPLHDSSLRDQIVVDYSELAYGTLFNGQKSCLPWL